MRTDSQSFLRQDPRIGFDLVVIVSTASVGALKQQLPVSVLNQLCHKFQIVRYRGDQSRLRSTIVMVLAENSLDPLRLLATHTRQLKQYWVTRAEVARDWDVGALDARECLLELVGHLGKRWHQRNHLKSEHEPDKIPPPGCLAEPTFYFEERKASVNLKCYARPSKLPARRFGAVYVRVEWTLSRAYALKRYLGGNKIEDLLNADLGAFVERNLRLEEVDHAAVGRLFHVKGIGTPDSDCLAQRGTHLVLRRLAHREFERGHFPDFESALYACQNSPAQVRA